MIRVKYSYLLEGSAEVPEEVFSKGEKAIAEWMSENVNLVEKCPGYGVLKILPE